MIFWISNDKFTGDEINDEKKVLKIMLTNHDYSFNSNLHLSLGDIRVCSYADNLVLLIFMQLLGMKYFFYLKLRLISIQYIHRLKKIPISFFLQNIILCIMQKSLLNYCIIL